MAKKTGTSISKLTDLLTQESISLLSSNGVELTQQIGLEAIRDVVYDVLCGINLRDSTEYITRRRISFLNLALFDVFIRGLATSNFFVYELIELAVQVLQKKQISKAERWLAQWILGLTDKAFQNILRDDPAGLIGYKNNYVKACEEVIKKYEQQHGKLSGEIEIGTDVKSSISWDFLTYFLNAIGAETLTIRGSAKSAYGKLFEKLVLGSLLHILGFQFVKPEDMKAPNKIFWLATRGERRESDATLIYQAGKGVRFDIGFIGRGNPEISLDKVSRFEREITLGKSTWYMATIILVDRIGEHSRIERLAKEIGGTIIQMSMGYWPQEVAKTLKTTLGYKHRLADMKQSQIGQYLKAEMQKVPLGQFIGLVNS